MFQLLALLLVIGVGSYVVLNEFNLEGWLKTLIKLVVVLCVFYLLFVAFGLSDVPLPRFHR